MARRRKEVREFLKEICRHGGFKEKASDEEKTVLMPMFYLEVTGTVL